MRSGLLTSISVAKRDFERRTHQRAMLWHAVSTIPPELCRKWSGPRMDMVFAKRPTSEGRCVICLAVS